MELNEKIEHVFQIVSKKINFDTEIIEKQTSITLNSEYYIHKEMLHANNFIASGKHAFAMPILNDVCIFVLNTTPNPTDENYIEKLQEFGTFATFYKNEVEVLMKEVLLLIADEDEDKTPEEIVKDAREKIDKYADFEKIMQKSDKWFNFNTYYKNPDFEYVKPTTILYSSQLYGSTDASKWLNSCITQSQKLESDDIGYVAMFLKWDHKISQAYSFFIFALITKSGVYLIDDRIIFQSFNHKIFTRRPERKRESWENEVFLPYDLFWHKDFDKLKNLEQLSNLTQTSDIVVFNENRDENLHIIEWNKFPDIYNEFIRYMIEYSIDNDLFKNSPQIYLSSTLSTKLLSSGQEIETKSYDVSTVIQHIIDDKINTLRGTTQIHDTLPLKLDSDKLTTSAIYDPSELITVEQHEQMIQWSARQTAINDLKKELNQKCEVKREDLNKFFEDIYNKDRMKIIKKLTMAKNIFVNREKIKFETFGNDTFKTPDNKPYVIKYKTPFIMSEEQTRKKYEFIFPMANFAKSPSYGYKNQECGCHHCKLTNQERIMTAHKDIYVEFAHYRELMWFFDLKREELPLALQVFAGTDYEMYYGNDILNDIDPFHKLQTVGNDYGESSSGMWGGKGRRGFLFRFALCSRCYNWLTKSSKLKDQNDEYSVDIDYQLLPEDMIAGKNPEYIAKFIEAKEQYEKEKLAATGDMHHRSSPSIGRGLVGYNF